MLLLQISLTLVIAIFCATANPFGRDEKAEQSPDLKSNFVRLPGTKHNQSYRLIDSMEEAKRPLDAIQKSSELIYDQKKMLKEKDDTKMHLERKIFPVKKSLAPVQETQGNSPLQVQSELSRENDERVRTDAILHHNGQAKEKNQIQVNGDQVTFKKTISTFTDVKTSDDSTERVSSAPTTTPHGGRSIYFKSRFNKELQKIANKNITPPSYDVSKLKKLVTDANINEEDLDQFSENSNAQVANEKINKLMTTDSGYNRPQFLKDDDDDDFGYNFPRGTFCKNSPSFAEYLKRKNYTNYMRKAKRNKRHTKCGCYQRLCDCSNINLTTIPSWIKNNTIGLDLMMNYIEDISDISKFSSLQFLRLCCNNISILDNNTFSGLNKLEYLSIAENNITMSPEKFPDGFFSKLTNLVYLELQGNNKILNDSTLRYPGGALVGLSKLETLHMDGLTNQTFGVEFKNLTSLKSVQLPGYSSGFCYLFTLNNTTFTNLPPSVVKLNLSDCTIFGSVMDNTTLKPLTNLKVLDISHNPDIGVKKFMETMFEVREYNITELFASAIITRYSNGIHILNNDVKSLPIHLEHLTAMSNSIESFDREVFDNLPQNLSTLDLSDNKLTFGNYLKNISKMKNLQKLRVEGSSYLYRIPKYYPREYPDQLNYKEEQETPSNTNAFKVTHDDMHKFNLEQQFSYDVQEERPYSFNIIPQDLDHSTYIFDLEGRKVERVAFVLKLPPNLNYISLSKYGLRYILSELKVNPNNALENLDINYNYFPQIWGNFEGLTSLKSLSLVKCGTYFINETVFEHLPSLENLDLNLNFLGKTHYFTQGLFRKASNLMYLNLENNEIKHLKKNTFEGLKNLRVLVLDNNPFWEFPVDLRCTGKLHFLHLLSTSLHTLDETIQQTIDNKNITVNMENTPIYCNCKNLQFLRWITKATSVQRSNKYLCSYEMKKDEPVTDMYQHITSVLEGECVQHLNEFYWVMSGCALILCAVLGSIIYRFRWKIRYFYYGAYLRFKEVNKDRGTDNFTYDVFLSYAFEDTAFIQEQLDRALTSRGLKVLVHGRDFVAGEYIASNIVTAVMQSRKTLVILTENLLKSDWCNYELQMANLESVNTGRPVLIFLIKDRLPKSRLGTQLLYHINNNTYKPYPPEELTHDETKMNLFWDSLVQDIKE